MTSLIFSFDDGSEAIAHYGVKGMRWGVRKDRKKSDPWKINNKQIDNLEVYAKKLADSNKKQSTEGKPKYSRTEYYRYDIGYKLGKQLRKKDKFKANWDTMTEDQMHEFGRKVSQFENRVRGEIDWYTVPAYKKGFIAGYLNNSNPAETYKQKSEKEYDIAVKTKNKFARASTIAGAAAVAIGGAAVLASPIGAVAGFAAYGAVAAAKHYSDKEKEKSKELDVRDANIETANRLYNGVKRI